MRNWIFGFCALVSLSACNAESTSPTSARGEVPTSLKQQDACTAITSDAVATAFSWGEEVSSESMGHRDGKRSLCRFSHAGESFWVRLGWKSSNAASTKVLERQFQTYLSEGENGVTYESIAGDTQLLGTKPGDASQPALHIYRVRFGNDAEIMFELYSNSVDQSTASSAFQSLVQEF